MFWQQDLPPAQLDISLGGLVNAHADGLLDPRGLVLHALHDFGCGCDSRGLANAPKRADRGQLLLRCELIDNLDDFTRARGCCSCCQHLRAHAGIRAVGSVWAAKVDSGRGCGGLLGLIGDLDSHLFQLNQQSFDCFHSFSFSRNLLYSIRFLLLSELLFECLKLILGHFELGSEPPLSPVDR